MEQERRPGRLSRSQKFTTTAWSPVLFHSTQHKRGWEPCNQWNLGCQGVFMTSTCTAETQKYCLTHSLPKRGQQNTSSTEYCVKKRNLWSNILETLELNTHRIFFLESTWLPGALNVIVCVINCQEEAGEGSLQNLFAHKIFLFNSIPEDYCGMNHSLANTSITLSAYGSLVVFSNVSAWNRFNAMVSFVQLASSRWYHYYHKCHGKLQKRVT